MSTLDLIIAAAVVASIGVLVLARGLIGRRVGDHPHCAECDFDLFGIVDQSPACPECGTSIATDSAVVIVGDRRRLPWLIWLGSFLLLLAIPTIVGLVWTQVASASFVRHKPLWWLKMELSSTDQLVFDSALSEIARRDSIKMISAKDVEDDLKSLVELDGTIRPIIRKGDRIPIQIRPPSNAPVKRPWLAIGVWVEDVKVDGATVISGDEVPPTMLRWWGGSGETSTTIDIPRGAWSKIAPGERQIRLRCSVKCGSMKGGYLPAGELVVEQVVRVVEDDSVTLVRTPELDADFAKAITCYNPNSEPPEIRLKKGTKEATTWLAVADPPAHFAFDVHARAEDGSTWPVATLIGRAGESWRKPLPLSQFGWSRSNVDQVDLILRPDPAKARDTHDLLEIYGGEIVIKGVRVVREDDPSTQPVK